MDGGGSLMNQAVHTVDLMQWLMGDVASVHSAMGIYEHKIETEDLTASVITFKSGRYRDICQHDLRLSGHQHRHTALRHRRNDRG